MKKAELRNRIVQELGRSLELLDKAARASHAEATHESSKAESKYDTRGLEAAYLAGGQARQAREIGESIQTYEKMVLKDFGADEPIDMSALVELEMNGEKNYYFIGPRSGGLEVDFAGKEIWVITPQAPLGEALMGKKKGESWSAQMGGSRTKYKVVSVS